MSPPVNIIRLNYKTTIVPILKLTGEKFEKFKFSEMEYSEEMCDEVRRFFALKKAK